MNKSYYLKKLRLPSKHVENRIKLIRKLNINFKWSIPENTTFYRDIGAGKKTDGWAFNFHFVYDGRLYGSNQSITNMLKGKKFGLFEWGRHIEITIETDE